MKRLLPLTLSVLGACAAQPVDHKNLDIDLAATPRQDTAAKLPADAIPVKPGQSVDWRPFFKAAPDAGERTLLRQTLAKAADAEKPEDLLQRARQEAALGLMNQAEMSYRACLRKDPENLAATIELAEIYLDLHRPDRGFEFLAQARETLATRDDIPAAWRFRYKYVLALALLQKGEPDKGRAILSDLIAADKSFTPGYAALASSYLASGNMSTAGFIAERGVDRGQDDPRLANILGVAAAREGKDDEARRWFDKALTLAPTFAPALINRANLSATKGQFEPAEGDLRAALAASPQNLDAHIALGIVQKRLGRFAEAQETLARAVDLNPESGLARYHLGLVLMERSERPTTALRLFHEVLQARESDSALKQLAQLRIASLRDHLATDKQAEAAE